MLPSPPIETPVIPSVAWSGRELLVLGSPFVGDSQSESTPGGWRSIPWLDPGEPYPNRDWEPGEGTAVVWAGDRLLAWGGATFTGFTSEPFGDGARYRPSEGC